MNSQAKKLIKKKLGNKYPFELTEEQIFNEYELWRLVDKKIVSLKAIIPFFLYLFIIYYFY